MRKDVAKSGESCGSKSITGYKNKDLFKRGLPLFFAIALFTIFISLFLAPTATPDVQNITYKLEGWTLSPSPEWTNVCVAGGREGESVPFRYLVNNTGSDTETQNITLRFDYKSANGRLGIIKFGNFSIPNGTIEGPFYESTLPAKGFYWWNFTISRDTEYNLTWCTRLSNESSLWPSPYMNVNTSGGNLDVPIGRPPTEPDLYASKSATVICDAINYTITYGNEGHLNQTNTVLVDDYDETRVDVTDVGGGGTDNGSAITWYIGNLTTGTSDTKSYTVSIRPGVANGTAIINNCNITGHFAENDTADNHYTVTSYAKVSPVVNFTTNSPQIYCYNITFNDTTTGGTPPYTYYWDFGDGSSSTEQNTSHRYFMAKTYDVTLTVTDANGCTNSTTRQVVVFGYRGGLSVGKRANVTSATVGTVIEYNITVYNTGDVNLTSVLVTDKLTGLNETIPFLEHGATQTVNTTYTVTESDICGRIINRATANGTGPCGFLSPTAQDPCWLRCEYTATLSITKEANVTMATIGTVIGYTINVSNTGNVNVTSVLVRDNLTGLNETISTLAPGATQTFNTTYTVTELDLSGWIINRATANGTDPCGYLTPTAIGVFGVRSG